MWLSKRVMAEQNAEDPATLGTVSIGGKNPAVVTDAEKRQAKVISGRLLLEPGGDGLRAGGEGERAVCGGYAAGGHRRGSGPER